MAQSDEMSVGNEPLWKSHKSDLSCGGIHQISIWQPTVIIDSHMHIQSGRCAPLQYLQGLSAFTKGMSRGWIEDSGTAIGHFLEYTFEPLMAAPRTLVRALSAQLPKTDAPVLGKSHLRALTEQSKKSTLEIGSDFVSKMLTAHGHFSKTDLYRNAPHLVLCSVVMTMDMEYAHIDGYFGIKVYNALYESKEDMENDNPSAYWTPVHGRWQKQRGPEGIEMDVLVKGGREADIYSHVDHREHRPLPTMKNQYEEFEKKAECQGIIGTYCSSDFKELKKVKIEAFPVLMPASETKNYEHWKRQVDQTEQVVLQNPLKLLPMFHYDPRRWQQEGNREPMSKVGPEGIYLGFKMYTAQGYRPWDPCLPVLKDFYARCCVGRVPIMNHCTPEGAATFEREEYQGFKHPGGHQEKQKEGESALDYFNEHFVSPDAWKKVLDSTVTLKGESGEEIVPLNTLRLCLAHFGGASDLGRQWNQQIVDMILGEKYPNLYTDISSSFSSFSFRVDFEETLKKYPQIKNRILFGTDWYMTLSYSVPLVGKDFLTYCTETKGFLDDIDPGLWPLFTQTNPYRFYRLDEEIMRIAENIITRLKTIQSDTMLKKCIDEARINDIYKKAAYIRDAIQGQVQLGASNVH